MFRSGIPKLPWLGSALLLAWAALAPVAAQEARPRLIVVEAERSFGQQTPTLTVEEAFVVRNEGGAVATLEVYSPGGRVRVVEAPEQLAPGEQGRIRVSADLRRYRGEQSFPFQVLTNDPERPEIFLTLTGEVVEHVTATPGYARWTVVQGETEGTIVQRLRATDEEPFEIVRLELPHPGLRAEHRREGEEWVVELTLDSWAAIGAVTGEVVVHTNHPRQPVALIPVSGFVRPILVVTPSSLEGEVELAEPIEQELLVKNFASEPIAVLRVEHEIPNVPPARVLPLEEGRSYMIVLDLGPRVPKGTLKTELTIVTDSAKIPTLPVIVDAVIR